MADTTMPAEIHPEFQEIWEVLALAKSAGDEVERLREENQRLKKQLIQYRDRARSAESKEIGRLSKLGYIVLHEGGDITDSLNEPGFIKWVRWAMTEGWAELTAPTMTMGWREEQPNTAADPIKAALGPLREELNLE